MYFYLYICKTIGTLIKRKESTEELGGRPVSMVTRQLAGEREEVFICLLRDESGVATLA